ncbi:Uncharacterised protein [uncultured Clostridium sp.]|nr:Uncharacterised protein [uncultured Clostridium sp.]
MKQSINHIANITMSILISEMPEGATFSEAYARKLVISQINSQEVYEEIDKNFDKIKNCETFYVNDFNINTKGAKVEVIDLNEPTDTDHLLEVIDALAYHLACYKYPNHKVHNSDDKEEILTDVGLHDYFKRELVKES